MADNVRYATVEGVRDLLSRVFTEDVEDVEEAEPVADDSAAGLPSSTIARRIRTAANQVDVALAPYYAAPFTGTVPGLVEDLTEAIAAYLATLTHMQSESLEADDPARLRYQWALDQLVRIGNGVLELPGLVRKPSPTAGHGAAGPPVNPIEGRMFSPQDFSLSTGRDCGWTTGGQFQ